MGAADEFLSVAGFRWKRSLLTSAIEIFEKLRPRWSHQLGMIKRATLDDSRKGISFSAYGGVPLSIYNVNKELSSLQKLRNWPLLCQNFLRIIEILNNCCTAALSLDDKVANVTFLIFIQQ